MNKKMMIILAAILIVAIGVGSFFILSCGGSPVVAVVDGVEITADDVSFRITAAKNMLIPEYFDMFPDHIEIDYEAIFRDGLTFEQVVRRKAVEFAAVTALYQREARRLGITLPRETIDMINEQVANVRSQLDETHPGGFDAALREAGFRNERQWINLLDQEEISRLVMDAIAEDDEEFARIQQFVPAAPATESATDRANAILARIRAGEDFDTLMNEYSEDPGLASFPDGYTFGPNEMVPEFEQGTRDLAIGEISEPIRSQFGYHIIMRIEPDMAGRDDDEELLGAKHILIMADSAGDDRFDIIMEAFEAMVAQAEIEFKPALDNIPVAPVPEEEEEIED